MDFSLSVDPQSVIFTLASTVSVLLMLYVLTAVARKVRVITSEMDSMRREVRLVDDSVQMLIDRLQEGAEVLSPTAQYQAVQRSLSPTSETRAAGTISTEETPHINAGDKKNEDAPAD